MNDRKGVLKLNTRNHTGFGIISYIISLATIIIIIVAIILSIIKQQSNIPIVGILQIIATICTIVGIAFGILGELTKETFKRYAHIGLAINIIALIYHIMIFIFAYSH